MLIWLFIVCGYILNVFFPSVKQTVGANYRGGRAIESQESGSGMCSQVDSRKTLANPGIDNRTGSGVL